METVLKKSFSERWKDFKDAYFAWARYNPFKVYGQPTKKEIYPKIKAMVEKMAKDDPEFYHVGTGYITKITTEKVWINQTKEIRQKGKKDKKKLRKELSRAFRQLF